MTRPEDELSRILRLLDEHIDLAHCRGVDERYRRALAWAPVDRPPLVVQGGFGSAISLPAPWNTFHHYDYGEIFESPAAMLQNMLLERVVPGVLLQDDNPLAIRNDHGTIQIASALGGGWVLHGNSRPWVKHLADESSLERIIEGDVPGPEAGLLPRSFETLAFYSEKLDAYPCCREAIQISMPDLQGPIDTAEQLWGSDIYYALADGSELLYRLLAKIVATMLAVAEQFRRHARDRLDPAATTQHGYMIPGRLLIRIDSAIMLSPGMYADVVRPHDAAILREMGGGAIHFCGNGQHLVGKLLEIPHLLGLDFGEPNLMEVGRIYAQCRERKAAITSLRPSREELVNGTAQRDFPTGCVLVYQTRSFDDAMDVVRRYQSNAA